jgi:hypothetical protein
LKPIGELWRASLFAHGIGSCVLGTEVYLAAVEDQDFDCVAQYSVGDTRHFTPIQMKELVPSSVNPHTSLQVELDKLGKYVDSSDLVVAFHLNREVRIDLDKISPPQTTVREIWLFGAVSADRSQYMLCGDLLSKPGLHTYRYPGL